MQRREKREEFQGKREAIRKITLLKVYLPTCIGKIGGLDYPTARGA
jgi:hypothetical protein